METNEVQYTVAQVSSNVWQEQWSDGRRKTWKISTQTGQLRRIECQESGEIIWYSYQTRVAEALRDGDWLRMTNRKYSPSTSRQLRKLYWIYSHRVQLDNALGFALSDLPWQVIHDICERSYKLINR